MESPTTQLLLVEDNANDLQLTLHAFRKANLTCPIHVARDGEEALSFVFGGARPWCDERTPGRVVLLDLKLPKVDGLEVLRALRSDARTVHLPVVVLTSSAEERDLAEAWSLGANGYVVKPVEYGQFLETVQTVALFWTRHNRTPSWGVA